MALGDPFASTLASAQQGATYDASGISKSISQTIDNVQQRKQQQQIRQQGANLLKQFGIQKPDGSIDEQKASEMGVTMNSNGEVTIKPASRMDVGTQLEIRSKFKTMQDQGLVDKDADLAFDAKGNPNVKSKGGMGMAYVREAQSLAPIIADQVEGGDIAGYSNSPAWVKAEVAREFQNRGKKLDDHILGYSAEKTAMGNVKIVDQKVQNAISAQVLLDSSYDPKTGNYKIAPSQHAELAIATARMLSPTGVVSDDRVNDLRQMTAREGLAKALIYAGADPKDVGGSTQSVINMFAKLIKREGSAAQKVRENYLKGRTSNLSDFTTGKGVTDITGITGNQKEMTATNPKTGEKLVYRGGKWQKQ